MMSRFTALKGAVLAAVVGLGAIVGLGAGDALAASTGPAPPKQDWPHAGVNAFSPFATYDRAALQRGFQVYKEVCSACHGMKYLAYRNLADLGFGEEEVKAIAAQYEVTAGPNDQGEMFTRTAIPADRFKEPFPNKQAAAAANNGKAPPDLSLIVKARAHHEDYIFALLNGYVDPPEGFVVPDGSYYNAWYPGHVIAMAQPIYEDGVVFADGTRATIAQQAADVTQFLAWAAEPHLETRREIGLMVILFLIVFTALMCAVKRQIWADQH